MVKIGRDRNVPCPKVNTRPSFVSATENWVPQATFFTPLLQRASILYSVKKKKNQNWWLLSEIIYQYIRNWFTLQLKKKVLDAQMFIFLTAKSAWHEISK